MREEKEFRDFSGFCEGTKEGANGDHWKGGLASGLGVNHLLGPYVWLAGLWDLFFFFPPSFFPLFPSLEP